MTVGGSPEAGPSSRLPTGWSNAGSSEGPTAMTTRTSSFATGRTDKPTSHHLGPLDHTFTRGLFVAARDENGTDSSSGVVYLYRAGQSGKHDDRKPVKDCDPDSETTVLCIPSIPPYVSPSDLLSFIGDTAEEQISHVRLLRKDGSTGYMALLKFELAAAATRWRTDRATRPFSSLQPERCTVVAVRAVNVQGTTCLPMSFPSVAGDPFMPTPGMPDLRPLQSTVASAQTLPSQLQPAGPDNEAVSDIPTCPVCLDRMDDGTAGLVTILCQHTFHSACLEKWRGNSCPVCRYTQHFSLDLRSQIGDLTEHECWVCRSSANLWICLICGNVGCGRYDSAHAFSHYEQSGHGFAMDIASQAVWDYIGDGYVNRLIHGKEWDDYEEDDRGYDTAVGTSSNAHPGTASGDICPSTSSHVDDRHSSQQAHPGRQASWNGQGQHAHLAALGEDMVPREKVDAMASEYTYLLSTQLYTQRIFFQDQVQETNKRAEEASCALEMALSDLAEAQSQVARLTDQLQSSRSESCKFEKLSVKQAGKLTGLEVEGRKRDRELEDERAMNQMLVAKLSKLTIEADEAKKMREADAVEIADLNDQIRDYAFFISSQNKIASMSEDVRAELVDGTLEAGPVSRPGPDQVAGAKKKNRKKKKKPTKEQLEALGVGSQVDDGGDDNPA